MTGYGLVNLKDMIQELGEGRTKEILSEFSCPLNKDVEFFLHCKAIEFARQGIAQTQLVATSYKDKPVLVGYFTLSNKVLEIPRKNISKNVAKKVNCFAMARDARRSMTDNYMISAPLIGQLGKNFANGYDNLIPGDVLLKLATDKVRAIQAVLGGKFVYLECEDKDALLNFYGDNGFVIFGKRDLDRDERDRQSGQYLVQLLKYLGD